MNWTDQDIDNLIQSVDETLQKAEALAKSQPLNKADDEQQDDQAAAAPADAAPAQDAQAAAPADAAPAADDQAAAAPAAAADDQAAAAPADQQAAPAADEQALQGEEAAPLSDEELAQIYGSMPPEELERHYSIIRQQLQSAYGQEQAAPAEAAPAAEQQAAPAPAAAAPAPEMQKSEKDQVIAALQKQVGDQAAAIEQITKAFEVLAKPSRKSITEIQYMAKSEADAPANGGTGETAAMTKEQVKEAARKLNPAKLEKAERDMVNKFYLEGVGQKEVEKLIHSKGGK